MKAYLRVYEKLRGAIVSGGYAYGARLPSKRNVAGETGTSLITVEHAYRLLCDDGYVEARERSGYFVCYRQDGAEPRARNAEPVVTRVKSDHHRIPAKFPFSVFARALRGVVTRYGERLAIKSPNMGTVELRAAIVAYLARAKGLKVRASQIVIGAGSEYLYGLLAQMFRRETIAIEDPSYAKIGEVYAAHGIRTKPLKLGPHGILDSELKRAKGGLLHVTPYRSFPSGVTADASKRHAYVRWAQERNALLIEDDFDSEFSPNRRGAETLFALSGGRRVIYLNTFSKSLAPALRIGYMVLPTDLVERYSRSVGFYSCAVPVFDQLFLADFINSGDFERHLNRLRRLGS